jgi:hypothetical protein
LKEPSGLAKPERRRRYRAFSGLLLAFFAGSLAAQELQPRAYIPAPVGVNFVNVGYAYNTGGLLFDPALPVEDGHVNANFVTAAFGQSLGVLGRSAQVIAIVPYVQADLTGRLGGSDQYRYRSGLGDVIFRYAMNIHGAPAMMRKDFAKYRQRTIVGASITVSAATGQYDPNLLINIGTNRWGFKPELGVSRAIGRWTIEGAAGVWFYTANHRFMGQSTRTQIPLGSIQTHLVRFLPHRTWLAFDATYYTGGRSQVNGVDHADYIANSRLGVNFGIAVSPRQAIRLSYFTGTLTRVGSDIHSIGLTYTFIWMKGHLPPQKKRRPIQLLASGQRRFQIGTGWPGPDRRRTHAPARS